MNAYQIDVQHYTHGFQYSNPTFVHTMYYSAGDPDVETSVCMHIAIDSLESRHKEYKSVHKQPKKLTFRNNSFKTDNIWMVKLSHDTRFT